jgi:hypothetical protein
MLDFLGLRLSFLESITATVKATGFLRDPCIFLLKFFAFLVCAFRVGAERVPWEKVCECIVAQKLRDFTEVQKILENCLTKETSNDTHGSWQ